MSEYIILDSADDIYMGTVSEYVKYGFYIDDLYERLQYEINQTTDYFGKGTFVSLNHAYMLPIKDSKDYKIYVSFEHRTGKKGEKVIIKMLSKLIEKILLKERTRILQGYIDEKKR